MNLLAGLADTLTGGLGKQIVDLVTAYLPPDMSPEKKAAIEMEAQQLEVQRYKDADAAIDTASEHLNERIAMYEGTAADLKAVPFLGALIIFLRGAFRPLMAYLVAYVDIMVLSKHWDITGDSDLKTLVYILTFLVLGFFFGEKAIQNVMPVVIQFINAKKA